MKKVILSLSLLFSSCSTGSDVNLIDIIDEVSVIKQEYEELKKEEEELKKEEEITPTPEPSVVPEEEITLPPTIALPEPETKEEDVNIKLPETDCSNPPRELVKNGGTKCIASATRNGTVVCLLDYSLTWKPWKDVTDHHNQTFKVNKNDTHFDKVDIVLKNKKRISLKWAGYHNPIYLFDKKVARQHYRNENIKWDDVKNKVKRIELKLGEQKLCLKP